jgi:type VII secretion protein EccB
MATRRDQLHSYQFLTQRVISAFVMRETDPAQSPLRRGIGAVFGGVMIAVLVAAGFGIYGILTKASTDKWKADGSVVIEKETGASFVYFDQTLYPTLNYASALLAAGKPGAQVFRVSSKKLSEAPRGNTVGIAGAPNSLPSLKQRVRLPWTVCTIPGTNESGQAVSTVAIAVAADAQGGSTLTDDAVLVRDARLSTRYLIWHGRRYQIRDHDNVVPALFGSVTPVPVGTAWVNSLPAGADISPINVPDRGAASPAVPGRKNGDVLSTESGSGTSYFVVFSDGLAEITPLQRDILRAQSSADPINIGLTEAQQAPRSGRLHPPSGDTAPPLSTPELVSPGGGDLICAVTTDAAAAPSIRVDATVDKLATAVPTGSVSEDAVTLADAVLVPAGKVAVVRALGSPNANAGPYYVITDLGIKYPVPSGSVLDMLGYPAIQAVGVPAALVSRIPTGPTLDPSAALQPARTTP